jgi:O-antigen/teichoic acid export membrane protein
MTRWYQPDDYGTFAVINNLATFIATASLLSLSNALPIVSSWHRRAQLLRSLVHLAVFAFILSFIGVALFIGSKYLLGEMDGSAWVFVSMPFLVLVISLHRIAQGWANADGAFRSMATARVIHPLIAKPSAILASMLTTSNPLYIVCFEGVGYLCQSFTMVRGRLRKLQNFPDLFSKRRIGLTFGVVRRHQDYSIYLNLVNLLMLGSITFQIMILANSYSVSETGLYSLAMSMASLPVQLVALATAPVIYHHLITINRDQPGLLFVKTLKLLVVFVATGIIPYLLLYFYGPDLFGLVFGSLWAQSGKVASLLALPLYLQFLYMPISSVFRVTATIKIQFLLDFMFAVPIIVSFYYISHLMHFFEALAFLALALSLHQLVAICFCLFVTWRSSRSGYKRQDAQA